MLERGASSPLSPIDLDEPSRASASANFSDDQETPEFQRQSDDFAAALRAAGKDVTLIVAPGYNHFEFAETFANPYGALGRASLKLMGLQPGAALIRGQRPK